MESQKTTQLWNNLIQDEKTTTTSRQILWAYNDVQKDLTIPIGIGKDDTDLVNIKINKTTHPHGIIMGMTGSGKSIALKTFSLTASALYSPNRVQFIYASTKEIDPTIKNLPHTIKTFDIQNKQRCEDLKILIDHLAENRKDDINDNNLPTIILLIDEPAASKHTKSIYNTVMSIIRQSRDVDIHCVIAAQNPKSIHASIYDNAGWTLMFNNIVSHPYKEILDEYHKDNPRNYTTGAGYLIEQHHNIQPVTVFDTTNNGWTLQYDAHSALNCHENDGASYVNNVGDNNKTFFFSLNNDPKRDEKICKQDNLKKINIMSSVRNGTLSLDPFFYTDDKRFIANILSRIIVSSMKIEGGMKSYAAIDDLTAKISSIVSQNGIDTAFEAIFENGRNGNGNTVLDENIVEYTKNRIASSSTWRAIFNMNEPEERIGIENLCGEHDGILFVLDGDISSVIGGNPEQYWNVATRDSVIASSLIYNCVKNYIEHHGGTLVVDDDYYNPPLFYLSA